MTRALRALGGSDAFFHINRDSLYFVSTWQPCPMCESVIANSWEFKPDNVVVLMLKEPADRERELRRVDDLRRGMHYVAHDEIQQSLFCAHPGYRSKYPGRCGDH
jgi:hypothetical protein